MKCCTKCLLPDSKPDLTFNSEGVCSACTNYDDRKNIDWVSRKSKLINILNTYRGTHYDCIIPVSGGKDSTFQVLTILQLGFKPLCVTATTCDLTDIGRRNIQNLKEQGVDYIEVSTNPRIRRKLNKIGLDIVGDISWPEHVAIFTIPIRVAVAYKIPLIIWGENSQNEYGGPAGTSGSNELTRAWLEEFGGLNGLRVQDIIDDFNVDKRDMWLYTYPEDTEMKDIGVTGLFLGYYMPWDGRNNAWIAQAHGFETYKKYVEGSCVDYENLDNYQTGIHDYFKWLKFGFGRTCDLLSMAIRRGQITREDAMDILLKNDGIYPNNSYLGKSFLDIIKDIGLTPTEFTEIINKFYNPSVHVS